MQNLHSYVRSNYTLPPACTTEHTLYVFWRRVPRALRVTQRGDLNLRSHGYFQVCILHCNNLPSLRRSGLVLHGVQVNKVRK